MSQAEELRPLYVRVHPADNVAIIVNEGGLAAGTRFESGLVLTEAIPEAHKVALAPIARGEAVIRYGVVIGRAEQDVAAGSWVHEGLLTTPAAPDLKRLEEGLVVGKNPTSDVKPSDMGHPDLLGGLPLEGFTFEGFVNDDGSVGTKNILGISTTVQCVAATVDYAVKKIKAELLPKYPNVDDVIAITHNYGCGIAIDAPGSEIPIRTLRNLSLNPNLGGAPMVVSLGCEKMQPVVMLPSSTLPVLSAAPYVVRLQDDEHHSFGDMVAAIMEMAEVRLVQLNARRRVTRPAADLVVGLQCGGSDAFSGVTANPAVGYAADLLVRAGATVMFSEVTEVRDAIDLLTARAADEKVARDLIREMDWYDAYLGRGGVDRSANPSPGNKKGGLANIVEKAMGSIAKSGTTPIRGVYGHGERVRTKGLVFAATPAGDFVCGTLQLAAAMNMHVFTTGRGTPYGLAMVPVIKVASRTALAERWSDLIDVDAGTIASGKATIEEVGETIFRMILDVASGKKETCADHWGLHNEFALFNPSPITLAVRVTMFSRRRFVASSLAVPIARALGQVRLGATPLIDSHVHVWKHDAAFPFAEGARPPAEDASAEMLLELMKANGVVRTVIVQVIHYRWDNRYLADVLRRYPGVFKGVCRVDPQSSAAPDELARLTEKEGFHGVRLSPGADGDWIRGPLMSPLWGRCAELKVPMTLLIPASRIGDVEVLIKANPGLQVVIDHMADVSPGRPKDLELLVGLARYPKVFVKISHLWSLSGEAYPYADMVGQVKSLVSAFGASRLMWGTDWPISLKQLSYGQSVALYRDHLGFLSARDREQILYRTVQEVWGFGVS